jgi:hypothetical protein
MNTPWGRSDGQEAVAKGIQRISTPRHGGFHLDNVRWAELMFVFPDFVPFAGKGWLEEDCDWAIAYAVWPGEFTDRSCYPGSNYAQAIMTLRCYLNIPESYWSSDRGIQLLSLARRYTQKGYLRAYYETDETDLILSNRDF